MSTTLTRRPSPFALLARSEARLFLRSPGSVLWTALLPLVALIVVGSIRTLRQPSTTLHGVSYLDAYLPILMIFVLCMVAVNLLPAVLGTYRENGVLRRMSTTPVPPSRLLGAQAAIFGGIGLAVSIVMLVIAVAAFGVAVPHQLAGFVVSVVLIEAAMLGLGVVIASLAPNSRVANGAGAATFFPLMFLAGLWLPRAQMPVVLRTISDYSPLGAGVHAVQDSIAGSWPTAQSLLVLVAYTVGLGWLATRIFRWE